MYKIGVIGDYKSGSEPHETIASAVNHSAGIFGEQVSVEWLHTTSLEGNLNHLEQYAGLFCAPGSPYESLEGAVAAIRYARENRVPFLGTCGGCQHAIIEIARNLLGYSEAQHEESDPSASTLFISKLVCSLAGKEMELELKPGTLAENLYKSSSAKERYYCNFGLQRKHEHLMESAGLTISGIDTSSDARENHVDSPGRIFELRQHPFFIATLFIPHVISTKEKPHPIVTGFVAAARVQQSALTR
jgi:CTP synthase (UTP-ammonia lyase)